VIIDLPPWVQESAAALLRDLERAEEAEDRPIRAKVLGNLAVQAEAIMDRKRANEAVRRHRARQRGEPVPLQRRGPKSAA
jgi:hypothetical protein